MQIKERTVQHVIILDVVGDLTYAHRAVFKAAVEKAKQAGCRHLIVNLEQVRFVDSAGLGLLVLVALATVTSGPKVPEASKLSNLAFWLSSTKVSTAAVGSRRRNRSRKTSC